MERGAQPGNGNAKKGAEWRQAIKRPLNQPGITISNDRFRPIAVIREERTRQCLQLSLLIIAAL